MSGLLGQSAVAIWHDIAAEGRDEFYAWHGQEHMRERVGIPGFLRGRRYIGIDAQLEFFNLYETATVEASQGKDYAERLNNPTPWTLASVKHFRSVARSICRVESSSGHAQGGLLATLRYDVEADKTQTHLAALRNQLLPSIARLPGIAGVHLLVADAQASGVPNAEQRARGVTNDVPTWILLIEGWGDEASFANEVQAACVPAALAALGGTGRFELDSYRHQITVSA